MAAKRVATSAVQWTAFAERVPAIQKDAFRAFKQKSDMFVSRVHSKPEAMPTIDWAFYKTRLANPALVDEFQKAYDAVKVPYPADPGNRKADVDAEEKAAAEVTRQYVAECQASIKDAKDLLKKIESVPPLDEMTQEMYTDYFPGLARTAERPTFWPHTSIHQPGNDPKEIK